MSTTSLVFNVFLLISYIEHCQCSDSEDCSVLQLRTMQIDYDNCTVTAMEIEDPCDMLEAVIDDCGDVWTRCHNEAEIQRMRDLHLNTFLSRNEDRSVFDNCSIVMEYQRSDRKFHTESHVEKCNQTQMDLSQQLFQNCSHTTSSNVYQLYHHFHELEDSLMIRDSLCSALINIGNNCVGHLSHCLRTNDLLDTRANHVQQMKTFLLRIFQSKVNSTALDNCDVDNVNNNYYDYNYEEEETTEIVKTTTKIENILNVGDIILSTVTERILTEVDKSSVSGDADGEIRIHTSSTLMEAEIDRFFNRKLEIETEEEFTESVEHVAWDVTENFVISKVDIDKNFGEIERDLRVQSIDLEINTMTTVKDLNKSETIIPRNSGVCKNMNRHILFVHVLITFFITLF